MKITKVLYRFEGDSAGAAVVRVTVQGKAAGISQVAVELTDPPVAAEPAQVKDGTWKHVFTLEESRFPYGCRISVTARAVDDDCDAADCTSVTLGSGPCAPPKSPAGCLAGLEQQRDRFVASHPDRFVASRAFTPLLCSWWAPTVKSKATAILLASALGDLPDEPEALGQKFAERLAERGAEFEKGLHPGDPVDLEAARQIVAETYSEVYLPAGPKAAADRAGIERLPGPEIAGWQVATASAAVTPDDVARVFAGSQGLVTTSTGAPSAITKGVERYLDIGWLGILFYDRLRLRPSGLAAGDQVYALSLAPGEEVTLTQRSETKRSAAFEEIVDQTMEQELEFNSTWSTGLTQQDADSTTSSSGGNLSASVGVDLFGLINVDIGGGLNAQDSHTKTTSTQTQNTRQTTRRAASKARQEHKTTFRVGTDALEEFGSRRVLRNANPSRALTLTFFKLYQKYRVILERHDAKLCVSLCVDDPGAHLRQELLEELAKLDPVAPAGTVPEIPAAGQQIQDFDLDNPTRGITAEVEFTTELPTGTLLTGWSLDITGFRLRQGAAVVDVDPSRFASAGGSWAFVNTSGPVVGSTGEQRHRVHFILPGGVMGLSSTASVRFTWRYAPDSSFTDDVTAALEAARQKVRDSFSADRVMRILEEVRAGARDLVFRQLFEQTLLAGVRAKKTDPPCDLLEQIRQCFDWNEAVIQYLPWWLTSAGYQRREDLRRLLLTLPGDTQSDLIIDDLLVASKARVYLPIRRGREKDAVQLLAGKGNVPCVADFIAWRDQQLGQLPYPLPDYTAITAIGPSLATPAGAADWEHDWERQRGKFLVLDEWSELLPTDGVHVEPSLSTCGATDEYRTAALTSDLRTSAALQEDELARAELARSLAAKDDLERTVVVFGDPSGR
ncbi:hypothetical protein ACRYCC_10690 [Actinomadura scrupuli]|uniref:hypothetical protein n=1 Tax=Actinomadura scrupuli TaxID=559629 RepID=UPI003D97989D